MLTRFAYLLCLSAVILALLGAKPPSSPALYGPSTGTGGPGTGTGTGTGGIGGIGGSGSYTSSGNIIYVVNISERKSASTYGYIDTGSGPTWQTVTGRHCVGMQFHSDSWSYTGDPPASDVTAIYHYEGIYVEEGTEFGTVPSDMTIGDSPSDGTGGGPAGTIKGGNVNSGEDLVVQTSATGDIASGHELKFWKLVTTETVYNDKPTTTVHDWYGVSGLHSAYPYDDQLIKCPCYDASITTRRTYGQPGTSGELPADPNAPLRHPNYGSWDYKGGLFVGNMPATGSDASGTARTELFVQGASDYASTYAFAGLSVYDRGKPSDSSTSGAIDLGMYFPSSLGSITESTVNWDNQWSITPGTYSSSETDFTSYPYWHYTLTDGNSDDYIVFPMYATPGRNPNAAPTTSLQGICLALCGESSIVTANTQCWHYLSSREYAAEQTSFPGDDSYPRVWLIVPVS